MKLSIVAVWIAASGLLGCGESQVGPDYQGEPLMTFQGIVKAPDALLTSDLVPALMFSPTYENLGQQSIPDGVPQTFMMYYTKGEVEGEFPSAFTLKLYDPPDTHVVEEVVKGEPAFVRGGIVAVSPEHPKWLRTRGRIDQKPGEAFEDVCSDTGQCLAVDLSKPCSDDNEVHEIDFNALYPCGANFPDGYPWVVRGFSESHGIIYFESDVAAGSVLSNMFGHGDVISAGYHVQRYNSLERAADPEEAAADDKCFEAVAKEATAAVNRIHGTNYKITDEGIEGGFQSYPDQNRTWDEYSFRSIIEHDCKRGSEIVDVSEDPIALMFTEAPPFGSTF